jgi:hypothetical protein
MERLNVFINSTMQKRKLKRKIENNYAKIVKRNKIVERIKMGDYR